MKYFYKVLRIDRNSYSDNPFILLRQSCPMDYDDFITCYSCEKKRCRNDDVILQAFYLKSGREFSLND